MLPVSRIGNWHSALAEQLTIIHGMNDRLPMKKWHTAYPAKMLNTLCMVAAQRDNGI